MVLLHGKFPVSVRNANYSVFALRILFVYKALVQVPHRDMRSCTDGRARVFLPYTRICVGSTRTDYNLCMSTVCVTGALCASLMSQHADTVVQHGLTPLKDLLRTVTAAQGRCRLASSTPDGVNLQVASLQQMKR